jgi:hypothetical protein
VVFVAIIVGWCGRGVVWCGKVIVSSVGGDEGEQGTHLRV